MGFLWPFLQSERVLSASFVDYFTLCFVAVCWFCYYTLVTLLYTLILDNMKRRAGSSHTLIVHTLVFPYEIHRIALYHIPSSIVKCWQCTLIHINLNMKTLINWLDPTMPPREITLNQDSGLSAWFDLPHLTSHHIRKTCALTRFSLETPTSTNSLKFGQRNYKYAATSKFSLPLSISVALKPYGGIVVVPGNCRGLIDWLVLVSCNYYTRWEVANWDLI